MVGKEPQRRDALGDRDSLANRVAVSDLVDKRTRDDLVEVRGE